MTSYNVGDSVPYAAVATTEGFTAASHQYYWTFDDGATAGTQTAAKVWSLPGIKSATVRATQPSTGGVAYANKSIPILGGGSLSSTLNTARCWHQSILLNNGKVLIVGGGTDFSATLSPNALTSCELYDPVTGLFTPTGSLNTARMAGHQLTMLPSGDILVTGGRTYNYYNYWWSNISSPGAMDSAEIYSVATGLWSTTDSMSSKRFMHRAVQLPSGKIMVFGGWPDSTTGNQPLQTTEIFDPVAHTWSSGPAMPIPMASSVCQSLDDGRVFLTLGLYQFTGTSYQGTTLNSYIYEEGGSFSSKLACPANEYGRDIPVYGLLGDDVIVGAGFTGQGNWSREFYIYHPSSNTWGSLTSGSVDTLGDLGSFATTRTCLFATGITTPGSDNGATYFVSSSATTRSTDFNYTGYVPTSTYLGNGYVLICGGAKASTLKAQNVAYLYYTG